MLVGCDASTCSFDISHVCRRKDHSNNIDWMVFRSVSFGHKEQCSCNTNDRLGPHMIISPLPQRKTEVNYCWFFFYHVCCRVVLRLALNLKLIKDTQQHSLLTWLFTFPSPFFFSNPFIHPSVLQWSLSLRIQADGTGSVLPDARWSIREGVRESKMEGGKEPKCAPAVMAQRCSLLWPVIIQRWTFPWAAPGKSCGFFQIFDLACSGS